MKICCFCEKSMAHSNYSKHINRCYIKKHFGVPKSEILSLIQGKNNCDDELLLRMSKLKKFTEKYFHEARELVAELKEVDPETKLNEMSVGPSTLAAYKSEWKMYSAWCKREKSDPLIASSANSYVASLHKRTTTLKKKRSILQVILQFLTDSPVVLRKIRRRISIVPKYSLSPSEVTEYLNEQAKINEETYLIQLLLITYGCRIHSVACLTMGDLDFFRKKIFFPDSKTGTREVTMTDKVFQQLKIFTRKFNRSSENPFLFSSKSSDRMKRSQEICKKVNLLIKQSSVLKFNKNYKFSSHMFRKTVAFTLYQRLVVEAKKEVRKSIGQAEESSAVEYYIA